MNSQLSRLTFTIVLMVGLVGCGKGRCCDAGTGPSVPPMTITCGGTNPTLSASATSVPKGTTVVISGTNFVSGEVTWFVSGWDPAVVRPKSPVANCATSWTYNTSGDVAGTTRQIYAVAANGVTTNMVSFTIR